VYKWTGYTYKRRDYYAFALYSYNKRIEFNNRQEFKKGILQELNVFFTYECGAGEVFIKTVRKKEIM